jgi:hypothetical protein
MRYEMRVFCLLVFGGLAGLFSFATAAHAQDKIMGQVQFIPASKAMKTSGVWIDGQYVGYVGELKGMNRLRLLPGDHEIVVRQAGYVGLSRKVVIEPRMVVDLRVNMDKDPRFAYPDPKTSSEVKLDVLPGRAAVFLDDNFVGNVDEFYGFGRGMLVAPGKHRFKIALAGYKTFETEVELLPRQKFALKTVLITGSINDADPIIRSDSARATSIVNDAGPTAAR